ncbi:MULTISPECIES: hypothetical protein [unclassified Haladaptatus]|uniref:hypothetical protein n=1 Tax=unclassified Haladaptatus TaxID=2622732 RepID=UPI00209C2857|nr:MULTISPECIES: hypothetical protein [unclassified Haladaptatus]MCO8246237.1 hypothetical protein [Haladaptatus sp. AB643]MCO8254142.1 hypothetical protein [Haladaptatus sp. AB618]
MIFSRRVDGASAAHEREVGDTAAEINEPDDYLSLALLSKDLRFFGREMMQATGSDVFTKVGPNPRQSCGFRLLTAANGGVR